MNIGDCPYDDCRAPMMLGVPDVTPTYALVECEECKRPVWYKFSRLDPGAWTKESFERIYEVDQEARTIKLRAPDSVGNGTSGK